MIFEKTGYETRFNVGDTIIVMYPKNLDKLEAEIVGIYDLDCGPCETHDQRDCYYLLALSEDYCKEKNIGHNCNRSFSDLNESKLESCSFEKLKTYMKQETLWWVRVTTFDEYQAI